MTKPILTQEILELAKKELMRKAGSAKSSKKAAAARKNGKLGGRPKKK